ncbi:unnamed protein product [Peronospora destructor]|uniref:Protein kinase domain-containing protein n=1 Tax=Peronospora destructor TaxID=86335 RepID=A0AAV0VBN8_9STRA|nr:unnamed protein product [Peronospora destructor]
MAAKLDDYVIQRRLAPALFGDVLLCQHKLDWQPCRQRALYHQLNRVGGHSNVLKLREEIEFDGYLYLVSDFCTRGELYELVSSATDGKLKSSVTQKYMRQIASGVQFLHHNGFAHRDLSLENVLVTDDDQCQVCDFGLATSTAKFSQETVGKLFYMAPEVLAGVQYNATKADVWSLGVMLFIMLIGAPPVETASSLDARFRLIMNKGVRKLIDRWGLTDDLPVAAIDLLSDMLEVDPEQRISMGESRSRSLQSRTRLVPSTSTRPESDGVERSGCRLLFHKIHRFFSRRHNKRVMAVNHDSGSSKRAYTKRLARGA